MKNYLAFLILASFLFTTISCSKDEIPEATTSLPNDEAAINSIGPVNGEDIDDLEKNILNPIIYSDDCDCPVSGTVELLKNGELIAIIDFGDGTCDWMATKTIDGQTVEFKLDCKDTVKLDDDKDDKKEYEKVIVNPLVYTDDCNCPVTGTIQYIQGDLIVATIDYGDGACDNIATKTTQDGTIEFELDCANVDDENDDEVDYEKVVVNTLVYLDDCNCPVAGTIQYIQGDLIVATIDYGDGACDNIATKTTQDGTIEFELDCNE